MRVIAFYLLLTACTTSPHPDEAAIKKAEQAQRENTLQFVKSRRAELEQELRSHPDSAALRSQDSFLRMLEDSINRSPALETNK